VPRFVVLAHDWPTPHYDLLLEAGHVLRAWRLADEPTPGVNRAVPNADHRLHYLDYEGPVGGDRGTVARWAAGEYEWVTQTPPVIEVRSDRLAGRLELDEGGRPNLPPDPTSLLLPGGSSNTI
jgi:DNA polymerase Ligase (LigD)